LTDNGDLSLDGDFQVALHFQGDSSQSGKIKGGDR